MFAALNYPGQIRTDAITAVGAPSNVQFLMRAIYWLFQVTRVYFMQVRHPYGLSNRNNLRKRPSRRPMRMRKRMCS